MSAPDPLSGPEEATQIARGTLKPLKIVGELHATRTDEDGNVVWDGPVGTIVVYAPHFDAVAETIRKQWPSIVEGAQ